MDGPDRSAAARVGEGGGPTPMRRIEFEIVEGTRDDGRRLRRVTELLAGGIYEFLLAEGYLRDAERDGNVLKKPGEDGKVSPASDGRKEYPDRAV